MMVTSHRRRTMVIGVTSVKSSFLWVLLAAVDVAGASALAHSSADTGGQVGVLLREYAGLPDNSRGDDRNLWIERFESAVSGSALSEPGGSDALLILSQLYLGSNDPASGIELLKKLIDDDRASANVRALASVILLSLLERRNAPPAELVGLTQKILPLLASESLEESRQAFCFDHAIVLAKAARWLTTTAALSHTPSKQGQTNQVIPRQLIETSLREAEQLLKRFDNDRQSLNATEERMLTDLGYTNEFVGLLTAEIALTRGLATSGPEAASAFEKSVCSAKAVLKSTDVSEYSSQQAAVLLLKAVEQSNPSEYVDELSSLVSIVKGGALHTVLNELTDAGMRLSRNHSRSTGNQVLELMIGLEQQWFPDEYRSHVNYQVGLLESAANCIELGQFDEVDRKLGQLRDAGVAEQLLRNRLGDIVNHYSDRVRRQPEEAHVPPWRRLTLIFNVAVVIALVSYFLIRKIHWSLF